MNIKKLICFIVFGIGIIMISMWFSYGQENCHQIDNKSDRSENINNIDNNLKHKKVNKHHDCDCWKCGDCWKCECIYTDSYNYPSISNKINIYIPNPKDKVYIWESNKIDELKIKFFHPPD